VAPDRGAWSFNATLSATQLHVQHIEDEDPGLVTPYWHNQHLGIGELYLSATRGLGAGFAATLNVPMRVVRDRIRFEDLARQPYTPPNPDTHHRNETLAHVEDPQLAFLHTSHPGAWTLSASAGTSIPIGRTEENPFALGRLGLPHQHIQFGTGTWDPVIKALAMRNLGAFGFSAFASAKLTLDENAKGYQAGNHYGGIVEANHAIGGSPWRWDAGLGVDREQAERWDGRIEEEGNLGRTDLFVQAGVNRTVSGVGTTALVVQVPIKTWATGEQVSFPLIVSLSWSR
jgi:hypothetical protein